MPRRQFFPGGRASKPEITGYRRIDVVILIRIVDRVFFWQKWGAVVINHC